ncbi:homoserine O-succinyltransferase [Aerococcaceae bacterium zg-ZUI334]|uniref:homoserine O-succinyltransferase n=1 Tax=Aerococcaceae bacterium zg-252 TaxID=2796928 RepID=UPI001B8F10F5|nr:homoserine O-succinyltransferase [Aerococcaceae bacterium zg-ZUI334]
MPITLKDDFPAKAILKQEDIFAINDERAKHQDIRPLKFIILNLMPNKIDTETQLLRLISQSPLQIEVDFLRISTHEHKNTSLGHLSKFYYTFEEIRQHRYDAMIITGAPVETLPFEQVDYWNELQEIMDWSQNHTTSTLHICWGAQAGLYHHYQVDKVQYDKKLFGVYPSHLLKPHRLFRGFDDQFMVPQSRYTGLNIEQLKKAPVHMIDNHQAFGPSILISDDDHNIFILGHWEYDTHSLDGEYQRDQAKGMDTAEPEHYYLQNQPVNTWRSHAYLFYHNWINDVYQSTHYRLEDIDGTPM